MAYVLIRSKSGGERRVELAGSPLLIGRTPDAAVRIDDDTVSRRHAELVQDPSGLWRVRDLGSRNGTKVAGRVVTEYALSDHDEVKIGDFLLTFVDPLLPRPPKPPPTAAQDVLDPFAQLTTLRDLPAPRIAAAHLSELMRLGQTLYETPARPDRLRALCSLFVGPGFHGRDAAALRVSRADGDGPVDAEILAVPFPGTGAHAGAHAGGGAGSGGGGGGGGADGRRPPIEWSRRLVRKARQTLEPVVGTNVTVGAADPDISIAIDRGAVAALACPLSWDDRWLDVLYVTFPPEYGNGEWLAMASLAAQQVRQADAAWDARRRAQEHALVEQELVRAREIQQRLLPRTTAWPGLEAALGFRTCQSVGGDYVDAIPTADGRFLLVVADVCGKGLQASMIAGLLHTVMHTQAHTTGQLAPMARSLDAYLTEFLPEWSFVTLLCVVFDPATGAYECLNAGHPPALVVAPDGRVDELQSGENFPLGIMPSELRIERGQIEPGQWLVLYTDGLTEMRGPAGKMLGMTGLKEYVRAVCGDGCRAPAPALADRLDRRLDAFQGGLPQEDDRTFLIARCGRSSAAATPATTTSAAPDPDPPTAIAEPGDDDEDATADEAAETAAGHQVV